MIDKTHENKNSVICICRRYRVQTPGGMIVEVDSDKPLSSQLNAKLLEEDNEIDEFFRHHTVKNMRHVVMSSSIKQKTIDLVTPEISTKDGTLTPRQRLNQLLKMKGIFTRNDYIKFLEDSLHYKLNKWTSHGDISVALRLKRIELVEEKQGRGSRKYKVVDTEEIGESLYEKLLEERKLQINTLT